MGSSDDTSEYSIASQRGNDLMQLNNADKTESHWRRVARLQKRYNKEIFCLANGTHPSDKEQRKS
jgi:hypothetical protein